MARTLKTDVLDIAARDYARMFMSRDVRDPMDRIWADGPSRVIQDLNQAAYNDEHDYLVQAVREELGQRARDRFDALAKAHFAKREAANHERELLERLAVTPDGDHREGHIGRVIVGWRTLGMREEEVEAPWSIKRFKHLYPGRSLHDPTRTDRETIRRLVPWRWPIYAGEAEERERPGHGVADPFPDGALGPPLGAATMGISNEAAIAACDAIVDRLDEGTGAAVIKIYAATRATDVDTAVGAQVLLATLVCSGTAFLGASDAGPGGQAAADTITSDTSADDTNTAAWFRASATNDGATPLDDHIDGNVGTTGEDLNLNTVAITAGATVSITGWTVTMPES